MSVLRSHLVIYRSGLWLAPLAGSYFGPGIEAIRDLCGLSISGLWTDFGSAEWTICNGRIILPLVFVPFILWHVLVYLTVEPLLAPPFFVLQSCYSYNLVYLTCNIVITLESPPNSYLGPLYINCRYFSCIWQLIIVSSHQVILSPFNFTLCRDDSVRSDSSVNLDNWRREGHSLLKSEAKSFWTP